MLLRNCWLIKLDFSKKNKRKKFKSKMNSLLLQITCVAARSIPKCPTEIMINNENLFYNFETNIYQSPSGQSTVAPHSNNLVWIYFSAENPIIRWGIGQRRALIYDTFFSFTTDTCPAQTSAWLQWDVATASYKPANFLPNNEAIWNTFLKQKSSWE